MRPARDKFIVGLALVLLAAALGMMVPGLSGYGAPGSIWHSLFVPKEDGNWTAISIDGKPVEPEQLRISIGNDEVTGGRDNCNDWGYAEQRDKNSERTIESTAVGCPEGDPLREAYWAIVHQPPYGISRPAITIPGARKPGASSPALDRETGLDTASAKRSSQNSGLHRNTQPASGARAGRADFG